MIIWFRLLRKHADIFSFYFHILKNSIFAETTPLGSHRSGININRMFEQIIDDLRGQACAIPRSVSPCFVTSRNRWTVFENYRSDGTLQKIARQFHTSPFSLWYRDGGQKKGGRSRKARKAFRTNYWRAVARQRERKRKSTRVIAPVALLRPIIRTNLIIYLSLLRPFPTCSIKSGQVATKFSISPVGNRADVARPINVYILHTRLRL